MKSELDGNLVGLERAVVDTRCVQLYVMCVGITLSLTLSLNMQVICQ